MGNLQSEIGVNRPDYGPDYIGSKRPSTAVQPPSAINNVPVTKLAASEARKTVGPTISSAVAQRLKTLLAA